MKILCNWFFRYPYCFGIWFCWVQFSVWAISADEKIPSRQYKETVTYCVDPDWMPYEAIVNGQHIGISADYLTEIAKLAKLDFKFIVTTSWQQTLDMARQGKCDVVSMLNQTPEREEYLLFTEPLFTSLNVLVSDHNQPFMQGYANIGGRVLGVVEGYRQAEYISKYYPQIKLKRVKTEGDGLELLVKGEIDVFVGSMLSVNHYIQQHGLRNLKVAGWASDLDVLRMGVSGNNWILLAQLNQAILKIPEQQHISIYNRWTNLNVVEKTDYRLVWIVIGSFILLAVLVGLRNRVVERSKLLLQEKNLQLEKLQQQLIEKNKALEFMSMHDPLTKLYNRNYMINCCNDEIQRIGRAKNYACLMLLDIDEFKKINDNYGHTFGDEILSTLSQIMMKNIREIDVAARWGGEEFLILSPDTNIAEVNVLAGRLCEAFSRQYFAHIGSVTFSIGLAEIKAGEDFVSWFDRADAALYQAKEAGRNCIVSAD